jgi:hypothetical protein
MAFTPTSVDVFTYDNKEQVLAKATELQNIGGFECERDLKVIREAFLKGKILNQEMLVFQWAVGHVASDGSDRRVNGQHSSQVFLDLTDDEWEHIKFPIWIAESHYHCDTPIDRAYLFNQFDPPQSSRGLEDNIGVHTALHDDLKHMDRYAVNKATQGVVWYFQQAEGLSLKGARNQFDIIHQNGEIHRFLAFCDLMLNKNQNTKELSGKPVVAAIFHTTRAGDAETYGFWKKVATASILDPESYHAKLADFLDKARKPAYPWLKVQRDKFSNRRKPNDREVFQACLRIYRAEQLGTLNVDPVDRLRDRSLADMIERYKVEA